MTKQVQVCVPENCLEDPRFANEVEYDQRIGRLVYEGSNMVQIDGETLIFPRAWIKHIHPH